MSYADILDKLGQTAESLKQYEFILCNCNSNDTILYDLERIFQKKLKTFIRFIYIFYLKNNTFIFNQIFAYITALLEYPTSFELIGV